MYIADIIQILKEGLRYLYYDKNCKSLDELLDYVNKEEYNKPELAEAFINFIKGLPEEVKKELYEKLPKKNMKDETFQL
ncbi:hypothetical protein P3W42_13590 [Bacillus paranthracis]|uniref:hypothetical protein n=1 Tax=Bacillus paranthracis TaxID=2026186 RepID=UPI002FDBB6D6